MPVNNSNNTNPTRFHFSPSTYRSIFPVCLPVFFLPPPSLPPREKNSPCSRPAAQPVVRRDGQRDDDHHQRLRRQETTRVTQRMKNTTRAISPSSISSFSNGRVPLELSNAAYNHNNNNNVRGGGGGGIGYADFQNGSQQHVYQHQV